MEALPGKLETNPYDYEAYTEWIRLLSQVGDIDSVRGAMERMHTVLAIPSDLWTMWIEKELNEAADADNAGFKTADSVKQIVHVFELATAEYLSLDMWQRYIDYARLQASDSEYRAAAEAAFESANFYLDTLQKAYAATCAHYSQSQAIWKPAERSARARGRIVRGRGYTKADKRPAADVH
ncbi:hypothetical protein DL89DRAFT_21713 [Linderina pennispora]|uniref:Suppressor of forked domain-containing protein n=1 Tax=Linderina pennispora TaxID=61395 RepID=A0A1Y1WMB6_9FUNG|nr:uncharacterized protein DL89DRAFT_21713 [Linderina pennispora]ORX74709.1 hypothetical protein DL89DRAFT_21713 [Linderina pennispora]